MSPARTAALAPAKVAEHLRVAVATGDFTALGDLYAEDARLDASLPGGRFRIAGPERLTEFLASRFQGTGRIVEWSLRSHPAGIAL